MAKITTVKTFEFKVKNEDGVLTTIYGKIEKEGKLYYWDVSHHFKPSPAAGYYYPSKTASSISEAEMWLKSYINTFTTDFIYNPNY